MKACGWLRRPRLTSVGGGEADPRGWLHGWCAWRQAAQEAVAVTEFRSRRAATRPATSYSGGGDGPQPSSWLGAGAPCGARLPSSSGGGGEHVGWTCSSHPARRRLNGGAEARQDSAAGSMRGILGGGGLGSGGCGGERATAALGSGLVPERVHAQPRQAGPQRARRGDAATQAARFAPLVRGCCAHQRFRATQFSLRPMPPQ